MPALPLPAILTAVFSSLEPKPPAPAPAIHLGSPRSADPSDPEGEAPTSRPTSHAQTWTQLHKVRQIFPFSMWSHSSEETYIPEEEEEDPPADVAPAGQRQSGAITDRGAHQRAGTDMRLGETKRDSESKSVY